MPALEADGVAAAAGGALALGLEGATLAGVDRSDWEKRTKTCIITVTSSKIAADIAIPFQVESSLDHWKNLYVHQLRRQNQEKTTCFYCKMNKYNVSDNLFIFFKKKLLQFQSSMQESHLFLLQKNQIYSNVNDKKTTTSYCSSKVQCKTRT